VVKVIAALLEAAHLKAYFPTGVIFLGGRGFFLTSASLEDGIVCCHGDQLCLSRG
jgi:hypothetical protein